MSRIFFLSIIILTTFQSGFSQKKVHWSIGTGLVASHHDLDEFDTWDESFLGNSRFNSYSYGLHGFVSYSPKEHYFIRTGIIQQNTRFNFSINNINTMNSFSIPLHAGYRWKLLSFFTGVEVEYAVFSYINRRPKIDPQESIIFVEDDSLFDYTNFDLNIPFGIELNIYKRLSIGIRSTAVKTQKVGSNFFNSKLRYTYFFFNFKF